MGWLFLFTLLNVALSAAIVLFLARRHTVVAVPAATAVEATPIPQDSDLEPLRALSQLFQHLLVSVDHQVASHSEQLTEINREVQLHAAAGGQHAIMAAVTQILTVNRVLTDELTAARAELEKQRSELMSLLSQVRTDALTGLANRRSLDEDLLRRIDQWRRYETPLAMLLLDVDHFKQLNDQKGHPAGDAVLRQLAEVLDCDLREMDLSARYGGEEFAVLLPNTNLKDACQVAERLRLAIAAAPFTYQELELQVTVSVGVTEALCGDSQQTLLERADAALYAAKRAGRNRSFCNDGTHVLPIRHVPGAARRPFNKPVHVAPYRDAVPDGADFEAFECHDLSPGGISFFAPQPPATAMLVVEMADASCTHYMLARVASVRSEGTETEPRYRIGCSFQGRLLESGAIAARPAPSAAPHAESV